MTRPCSDGHYMPVTANSKQVLDIPLAGMAILPDGLAFRSIGIEDAGIASHDILRNLDLVCVRPDRPAMVRGVTFASRSHLADVAGRHAVAFLRALFEDKLLQFVGLRLVLLQTM